MHWYIKYMYKWLPQASLFKISRLSQSRVVQYTQSELICVWCWQFDLLEVDLWFARLMGYVGCIDLIDTIHLPKCCWKLIGAGPWKYSANGLCRVGWKCCNLRQFNDQIDMICLPDCRFDIAEVDLHKTYM